MNPLSPKPNKKQQLDFIFAGEQFPAYIAGVGCGKSTALIYKALQHSHESPGNLGVIVRKNFTDLRDSTLKDYEQYTGRKVNTDRKEDVLPNGSVIMFRHGDELPTLKNVNLGFFGIEQAEEFGDSTTWDMLTMRLRREAKFRSGFLIANANGHNWIYKKWIENGPPANHLTVQARTHDFADILPPDYIKNLEDNLPQKLYRRFVLNSHEEAEGLVYDEYREDLHVIEPHEIPETWERGFCLDHGFRNPTAVLWYAVDHDDNLILYDEHYESEKTPSAHSIEIKKRGLTQGIADPSIFNKTIPRNGKIYSIADEYDEFGGIILYPSARALEEARIARVNELFKAGRIKVFRTLKNFRNEIQNWKYAAPKPGAAVNLKEQPEDKDNHLMDDLGYIVSTRFQAPQRPEPERPNWMRNGHYVGDIIEELQSE